MYASFEAKLRLLPSNPMPRTMTHTKKIPFSEQYVRKPRPFAGELADIRSGKLLSGNDLASLVERYPDAGWPPELSNQLRLHLRGKTKPSRGRRPKGEPVLSKDRVLSGDELAIVVERSTAGTWPPDLHTYLLQFLRQEISRSRGRPAYSEAALDFTLADAEVRYRRALSKIQYCLRRRNEEAKKSRRKSMAELGKAASKHAYEVALRLLRREEDRIANSLTDEERRHFRYHFRNVDTRWLQNAVLRWRKGQYPPRHEDPDEGPGDFG